MLIRVLTAAIALMSAGVLAQMTIPVPAGSTDSGARAVVGIAPVDLSPYARSIDVPVLASSAVAPWPRNFPWQQKYICANFSGCFYVAINDQGYVSFRGMYSSWVGMGYTSGGLGITSPAYSAGGLITYKIAAYPTAFDSSGSATSWAASVSEFDGSTGGGPGNGSD
jgi:hypothetical protein